MKCARVLGSLLALCALLAPGVAHAQIFSVYIQPKPERAPDPTRKAPGFKRLHFGSFLAIWDQPPVPEPPPLLLRVNTPGGARGQTVPIEVDAGVSPLVTADYYVTRNISLGGWWNPINGTADIDRSKVPLAVRRNIRGETDIEFLDHFYDFHAAFHFPDKWAFLPSFVTKGLTLQAGYSVQNVDLDAPQGPNTNVAFVKRGILTSDFAFTLSSPNVWITKTMNLGTPFRGRKDRPILLFASGGRYFAEDFDNAWNAMGGLTFTINPRLSLSASYWRSMPRRGEDQTRISLGVSGRY